MITIDFISAVLSAVSDALMLPAFWPFVGLGLLCVVAKIFLGFLRT